MNTRRLLFFLPLLSLLLFLYACGECSRRIDCPGFSDDTLTRLFPYSDNQRLVFRSDTGSTLTFTVKNTRTSEPYQARGGFSGPLNCSEEKVFESAEQDTTLRQPLFSVYLQSGNYQSVDVRINRNSFYFNDFSDTAFKIVSVGGFRVVPIFQSSVSVGNRTFTNVTVAQRDTTGEKRTGAYRLFYTRAEGIVGYTDYPSNINWVKQ